MKQLDWEKGFKEYFSLKPEIKFYYSAVGLYKVFHWKQFQFSQKRSPQE